MKRSNLWHWCSGKGNEIWKEGKLTMVMTITENNDNDNDRKQQLPQPVLVAILVSTWSNVKLKSRMLSKSSSSCLLTALSWNFRRNSETGCQHISSGVLSDNENTLRNFFCTPYQRRLQDQAGRDRFSVLHCRGKEARQSTLQSSPPSWKSTEGEKVNPMQR